MKVVDLIVEMSSEISRLGEIKREIAYMTEENQKLREKIDAILKENGVLINKLDKVKEDLPNDHEMTSVERRR